MTLFRNRADAARQLVAAMPDEIDGSWLILAVPRGGTPLAATLARSLGAELDLLIVRKVGLPGYPELAVAAVTGPEEHELVENAELSGAAYLSAATIRRIAAPVAESIPDRRARWTGSRGPRPVRGRDVVIVDDGVATGTSLLAAVAAARKAGARRVAVAVPVALAGALDRVSEQADLIVCPHRDCDLRAVGLAYERFPQVGDDEVAELLADPGSVSRAGPPGKEPRSLA